MLVHDIFEQWLGIAPALLVECDLAQAELELREEIVGLQETLDPMVFLPIGIQLEKRRGPQRRVLFTNSLEVLGLLAHVQPHRNEIFLDEPCDAVLRVHLGIQPSAAASHGCGAEIEEDWLVLSSSVIERLVDVPPPTNFHLTPLVDTVYSMKGAF